MRPQKCAIMGIFPTCNWCCEHFLLASLSLNQDSLARPKHACINGCMPLEQPLLSVLGKLAFCLPPRGNILQTGSAVWRHFEWVQLESVLIGPGFRLSSTVAIFPWQCQKAGHKVNVVTEVHLDISASHYGKDFGPENRHLGIIIDLLLHLWLWLCREWKLTGPLAIPPTEIPATLQNSKISQDVNQCPPRRELPGQILTSYLGNRLQ